MMSWLYSGVWFLILFGTCYLMQPRTYSSKGKIMLGSVLIVLGAGLVLSYVAIFSGMRLEVLIALFGGIALGFTAADTEETHSTRAIAQRLLGQAAFQERLKDTTKTQDTMYVVMEANSQAMQIRAAGISRCAWCGQEFSEEVRYVVGDRDYCSHCADKKRTFYTRLYYGWTGLGSLCEIGLVFGVYVVGQHRALETWKLLSILVCPLMAMLPGLLIIRGIVRRGITTFRPS